MMIALSLKIQFNEHSCRQDECTRIKLVVVSGRASKYVVSE